ncbi:MAG: phage capsid protein, partial [Nitrososphaerales archaeon]|nr:phage capsid protein [Nitrososphaerales archaeon]
LEEGYDGEDLVAVIHPKQYQDLLQDETIKTAMQFGALSNLEEGVVAKLYGIDIVVSTKVPTGFGSGTPPVTTYRAFVFKKEEAVGLGISRNLTIETERRTDERKLYITATHRIAAAVKAPKAVVKIITA